VANVFSVLKVLKESFMKAINQKNGKQLADKLVIADSLFSRMKGLLGRDSLLEGEALLIKPCKSIHTFGMRFPIDIVFLDKQNEVVATGKNILPNRMSTISISADCVLELPSGVVDACEVKTGDFIAIS
jgi:uncharacterized membrane protein (UPF0127 family)